MSPQAALIVKPVENVSVYGAYSVSYLPASGDQFSSLTDATLILDPQKFENKEIGAKWNINPKLQFTAAIYELNRTNQPIPDPTRVGFSLPNGATKVHGFETGLNGYVTEAWQSALGYAYTDARIDKDLSRQHRRRSWPAITSSSSPSTSSRGGTSISSTRCGRPPSA